MLVRIIQAGKADEAGGPVHFRKLLLPFSSAPTLAALTPRYAQVELFDDYVDTIDYNGAVNLAAVTAQTCQAPRAYRIGDEFRRRGVKTVMTGCHASACPEEALRHFDAVIVGEVEHVWERLLRDVEADSLGQIYRSSTLSDLSRPIVPRYDLIDYSKYVTPVCARTPLLLIETARPCSRPNWATDTLESLLAPSLPPGAEGVAQGAPGPGDRVRSTGARRYRYKPICNVLREIEAADPSRLFIVDEDILADAAHARELFEALRPKKRRWSCKVGLSAVDEPALLELAAEAGCHEAHVNLGDVLNAAGQDGGARRAQGGNRHKELFALLKSVGILPQASIVFGVDNQTADSLRASVDEIVRWDINYLYIALFTPFPGTEMYERMHKQGRLSDGDWGHYDCTHCVVEPAQMSRQQLENLVWESYDRFYSRPAIAQRLWRFRREYLRFWRRDVLFEELFFQMHCHRAVRQRRHPFSLGLESPLTGHKRSG